jgi:hypothetical protein
MGKHFLVGREMNPPVMQFRGISFDSFHDCRDARLFNGCSLTVIYRYRSGFCSGADAGKDRDSNAVKVGYIRNSCYPYGGNFGFNPPECFFKGGSPLCFEIIGFFTGF